MRYVVGHARKNRVRRSVDYVETDRGYETPCLIWQGPTKRGYGIVAKNDRPHEMAHRVAYERANGPLDSEQMLHHLCEVKLCCNPDHLQALSRSAHTRLHRPTAKLDEGQVQDLRRAREECRLTYPQLAKAFGIGKNQVGRIVRGQNWCESDEEFLFAQYSGLERLS